MRLGMGQGLVRLKQQFAGILSDIGVLLTSSGKFFRTSAGEYFNVA
jgi:hypothetical protein